LNRRRQPRVPLQLEVEYRTSGNFLVAYSRNLSKGGVFLQSDTPMPVGTPLSVRLRVPGVIELIEVDAVVAWVRPPGSSAGLSGMGIEFGAIDQSYGELIDRIVAHFDGFRALVIGEPGEDRALLSRYLRSIVTCDVLEVAVNNATTAGGKSDLAVIDLESSGVLGLGAIRALRARGWTPVLALANSEELRTAARALGAEDLLQMPPSFPELQLAVIRALSRPVRVS
jgi:uncharacterized protein (TIGR02266 family)